MKADLKKLLVFCSKDPYRANLNYPYRLDAERIVATDGVRFVVALDNETELSQAPWDVFINRKLWEFQLSGLTWSPLSTLPKMATPEVNYCHKNLRPTDRQMTVTISFDGVFTTFDENYLQPMVAYGDGEYSQPLSHTSPMRIRYNDGARGMIMPLGSKDAS